MEIRAGAPGLNTECTHHRMWKKNAEAGYVSRRLNAACENYGVLGVFIISFSLHIINLYISHGALKVPSVLAAILDLKHI